MVWTSSSQFILLGWFVLVVMNRSKKSSWQQAVFRLDPSRNNSSKSWNEKNTFISFQPLGTSVFFFQMLRWVFGSTRWFWFQSMHQNSTSSTLKEVQLIPNWQLRNETWKQSGSLGYIGDYTTQLFRGYNKPLKGPQLNNQVYWKVIVFCTFFNFSWLNWQAKRFNWSPFGTDVEMGEQISRAKAIPGFLFCYF